MNVAKITLLVMILACPCSLAAPPPIGSHSTVRIVANPANRIEPVLAANFFKWLDELINGARKVSSNGGGNLPQGAYQYTQHEDRRRSEHGLLYYLAVGVWRLAAAGGAAAIAGKAVEKQAASAQTKNVFIIAPFLVGLIWPLVALAGAGIVWMACGEKKSGPPGGR